MKIYFVRNTMTNWTSLGKIQGKTDIPLSKHGFQDAINIAKECQKLDINLIISSSQTSAKQTSLIIGKTLNVPIIYNNSLVERDMGEFEGKKEQDVDLSDCWDYERNEIYNHAENIQDFFYRIEKTLDEITNTFQDKNILIVSHMGVSIIAKCYFDMETPKGDLQELAIENQKIETLK